LGCIIGSFYNVIIYRLPLNQSIAFPRSHCQNCKSTIPFYLNIPILSYVFLKSKCNYCGIKISVIYPLVEFISGILWAYSFSQYDIKQAAIFCIMTGILTCISFIDFKTMQIPISLLLLLLLFQLSLTIYNSSYFHSFIGALAGSGFLCITYLITLIIYKKHAMGFGDIIIIFILGMWMGPLLILITIFLSSFSMMIVYLILLFKNKSIYRGPLPFVPSLTGSAIFIKILTEYINI